MKSFGINFKTSWLDKAPPQNGEKFSLLSGLCPSPSLIACLVLDSSPRLISLRSFPCSLDHRLVPAIPDLRASWAHAAPPRRAQHVPPQDPAPSSCAATWPPTPTSRAFHPPRTLQPPRDVANCGRRLKPHLQWGENPNSCDRGSLVLVLAAQLSRH